MAGHVLLLLVVKGMASATRAWEWKHHEQQWSRVSPWCDSMPWLMIWPKNSLSIDGSAESSPIHANVYPDELSLTLASASGMMLKNCWSCSTNYQSWNDVWSCRACHPSFPNNKPNSVSFHIFPLLSVSWSLEDSALEFSNNCITYFSDYPSNETVTNSLATVVLADLDTSGQVPKSQAQLQIWFQGLPPICVYLLQVVCSEACLWVMQDVEIHSYHYVENVPIILLKLMHKIVVIPILFLEAIKWVVPPLSWHFCSLTLSQTS